jgi:hypothetical protein
MPVPVPGKRIGVIPLGYAEKVGADAEKGGSKGDIIVVEVQPSIRLADFVLPDPFGNIGKGIIQAAQTWIGVDKRRISGAVT